MKKAAPTLAGLIAMAMLIYPPWYATNPLRSTDYAWVWQSRPDGGVVNVELLMAQIAIVVGIGVLFFRYGPEPSPALRAVPRRRGRLLVVLALIALLTAAVWESRWLYVTTREIANLRDARATEMKADISDSSTAVPESSGRFAAVPEGPGRLDPSTAVPEGASDLDPAQPDTAAAFLTLTASHARADTAEAVDRAYQMAAKYSALGYYMSPSCEGHGDFGVTYELEVPVNRGLDYVFIVAGDHFCEDVDVWVLAEETGNTIVKDTRNMHNALAGVRWRSDYNGQVNVVVHFARVRSRCGWCAVVGCCGKPTSTFEPGSAITTVPGEPQTLPGSRTPLAGN